MSNRKSSMKATWDEYTKDKNHISHFDDDGDMSLTYVICTYPWAGYYQYSFDWIL